MADKPEQKPDPAPTPDAPTLKQQKLRKLFDAAARLAAAKHRKALWANTALALSDHKPTNPPGTT
jgi:hypothetical protein